MNVLNQLSTMYSDWLDQQKIEDRTSADELYFGNPNLTGKQKTWLANFIETWELQALAPRLTKLYEGSSIHDLLTLGTDAPNAIACDWDGVRACFNKI
jgi:hypothetical protein